MSSFKDRIGEWPSVKCTIRHKHVILDYLVEMNTFLPKENQIPSDPFLEKEIM